MSQTDRRKTGTKTSKKGAKREVLEDPVNRLPIHWTSQNTTFN